MNEELTRQLIASVGVIDRKVGEVQGAVNAANVKVARVEEKQSAMRAAQEERHGDNRAGMDRLIREVGELRKESEAARFENSAAYQKLEARVAVIEAAEKTLEEQFASAAFRGGGIGGLIATAVAAAMTAIGWLAGVFHFTPPKL